MAVVKVKSPAKIKNPSGKQRRSVGKVLNLAATYGMGGATAGSRLGKSAKEGQELLDNFFKGFPKVKEAIEYSKAFLREHGYVEDFVGRRRHLPEIFLPPYEASYKDKQAVIEKTFNPILGCQDRPLVDAKIKSYLDRAAQTRGNKEFDELARAAYKDGIILSANTGRIAKAQRQCFNARIQGSAASLTKLAMIDIFNDERLQELDAHLVISVHDEVLVECPALYADQVEVRLPQIMVDAAAAYDDVPQACDPYQVYHWYEEEYTAGIVQKYSKMTKAGMSKQQAIQNICQHYPELTYQQVDVAITTGNNIEF